MQSILNRNKEEGTNSEVNSVEILFSILLVLLPLFFLPFTADAFSVNKTYLVLFISSFSLLAFLLKGLKISSLRIVTARAYAGILFLLAGGIVSAMWSVNQRVSVFGSFGNYEASLLFIVGLFVIGFVSSNAKLRVSRLFTAFSLGVTLTTLISFLAIYGIPFPGIGSVPASFTLVGGTNVLFALQAVSVITALYYYYLSIFSSKDAMKANILELLFYGAVVVINLSYVIIGSSFPALFIITIGVLYLLGASHVDVRKNYLVFVVLVALVGLLAFVHYFPTTRSLIGLGDYNKSLRLPISESWLISTDTIKSRAFTGSGLGTFVTDFTRFRPATLNAGDMWNVRFIYPFNDVFLWLASAGLIGLACYALFWYFTLRDVSLLGRRHKDELAPSIMVVSIFLSLLFLGYNMILYVFLFMLIGVVARRKNYSSLVISSKNLIAFFALLAVGILAILGYTAYNVYSAQYYFRKSLFTNNLIDRYELQRKTLNTEQYEGVYRRAFVSTNLFIARELSKAEKPTETDVNQINQLVSQSVRDVRFLTEVVDPLNVANWDMRGQVYSSLMGVAKGADQFAISSYSNAINLEPTNPKLWLDLGSVYHRAGDYPSAVQAFVRSVQLKNDYANAHYNLAFALKETGDLQNAVIQLEIVDRLIPQDSPDRDKLNDDLETFRKLEKEAREKQAQQLSVEGQSPEEVVSSGIKQTEPLTEPKQPSEYQLEENVDIPEKVLSPEEKDVKGEGSTTTNGNTPGAPLAKPPVE